MRDKEQERFVNRFKYTLIRIRFPDGLYLQVKHRTLLKLSTLDSLTKKTIFLNRALLG